MDNINKRLQINKLKLNENKTEFMLEKRNRTDWEMQAILDNSERIQVLCRSHYAIRDWICTIRCQIIWRMKDISMFLEKNVINFVKNNKWN